MNRKEWISEKNVKLKIRKTTVFIFKFKSSFYYLGKEEGYIIVYYGTWLNRGLLFLRCWKPTPPLLNTPCCWLNIPLPPNWPPPCPNCWFWLLLLRNACATFNLVSLKMKSCSLRANTLAASISFSKVTKPKPRDTPVGSVMMRASLILPK